MSYNVEKIRKDFPILHQLVHKRPLVYLDNAATSQKPKTVIDAITYYYQTDNANVHRGVHQLSERATRDYENARGVIKRFINARDTKEVIFVRGTTEGINLIASSYGRRHIKQGDEIIISVMEHHSNIVPWQLLCEETGAVLKVVPVNDAGEFIMSEYDKLLSSKTKLVSVVHISNALGTINPVKEIIEKAHKVGALAHIDGAQAAPHLKIDVQELDCDFYTFSSHKVYGPTGVGALYGKEKHLDAMPPYQGGGDMISSVSFDKTLFNILPYKFEAGTPHIAGAIGFAKALEYITEVGLENIARHEHELLEYATDEITKIQDITLIGTAKKKAGVLSFTISNIHPHDIGTILDREGVAIRTGHHCAQPLMNHFDIPATARASFGLYNTMEEVDAFVQAVRKVHEVFK
jgi:cysteine desulfurase/selenocysteine lyase